MSGTASPMTNQADVDKLAQVIQQHRAASQPGAPMAMSIGTDAHDAFCKNWDTVKPVLTALSGLLAAIPGVGIFAGPAIAVVITAGDAAKKAICK